jgi:cytochrome d ubiquinol oxidase subunit I
MNTPSGIEMAGAEVISFDPLRAMANPGAFPQTLHMTLAAFAATGFGVAGIHAWRLLREPASGFHRRALAIALTVGAPAALLMPLSGDINARFIAKYQPAKLAAAEGLFETRAGAPMLIGGFPDVETRTVRYAIAIPGLLSLLAHHDPDAVVTGLDRIPRDQWPPVPVIHIAFQVMVGLGSYLALLALWVGWVALRKRDMADRRWLLRALVVAAPLGFIATEAGWVVTEVGRQPWIIQGIMRTADAVTPMPGLVVPFLTFTVLYLLLAAAVVWILHRQIVQCPSIPEDGAHA